MENKEYLDFIKTFNKYEERVIHITKILYKNNLCYSYYDGCKFNDKTIKIETSEIEYRGDDKYFKSIILPYEILFSDNILNEFIEFKNLENELDKGIKEPWNKEKLTRYLRLEKIYNN